MSIISGCFVPKIAPKDEQRQLCKVTTKKLIIDLSKEGTEASVEATVDTMFKIMGECDDPECLLAAPVIVPIALITIPAGSFIVSGSIVVVGNTINWIEQQGRCEESVTRKAVSELIDSTTKIGGKVINRGEQLVQWFQEKINKSAKDDMNNSM